MSKPRLMSGMRPTGRLHMGNYMGALKNWVKMQDDYECFFGVVDWHAMTDAYRTVNDVRQATKEFVAEWVAWGIDPKKSTIFIQSLVPEHIELHMMFSNITPVGWLERVTTWKDAEEELKQKDAHNLGRFAYPVLQAADIAVYRGQKVPVGRDQVPHLELAREIIRRFNHLYSLKIPEPEAVLTETPALTGTDGRKMSKSYGNIIPLTMEEPEIKDMLRKMPTDPQRVRRTDPGEPTVCPVYGQHKMFSSQDDLAWVEQGCRTAGIGCGDCKGRLGENLNKFMQGPRERKKEILNDSKLLGSIIDEGCQKARVEAQKTLKEVRAAMGFYHSTQELLDKR
ncbi:MAG: tryptophan--tRNA ligase [Bdellovibrionales bacterium]